MGQNDHFYEIVLSLHFLVGIFYQRLKSKRSFYEIAVASVPHRPLNQRLKNQNDHFILVVKLFTEF
jgi:hypothetical protein